MNAAVVYWSGTGNTEAMAQAVAEGIQAAGGTAEESSWKTAKWSRSWKNWSR